MSTKERVEEIKDLMNLLEQDGYVVEPHDGYVDIIDKAERDVGNPLVARISHGGASWLVLD